VFEESIVDPNPKGSFRGWRLIAEGSWRGRGVKGWSGWTYYHGRKFERKTPVLGLREERLLLDAL